MHNVKLFQAQLQGYMVFVTDFDGGSFMFYDGTKWGTLSFTKTIPDAPIIGTACR